MYVPAQLFYNDEVWLLLSGMRLNQEQSSGFTRCGFTLKVPLEFREWLDRTHSYRCFLRRWRYNHLSGLAVKKDASWFVLTVQLSRPHNVYTRFHSWRLNFTHTIHDSRASYLQTDLLWILTFFQVCTSGIHVWQRMPSFGNLPDRCPAQRPLHGIHFPCIHCRLHIRSNDYFPRFNRTSLLVQVYATNASVLLLVHTRSDPWHKSIKFFYIDI
jgi:hypothetical protein